MKRLISIVLIICMALCLGIPAMASDEANAADEYAALSLSGAEWTYNESADAWSLTDAAYCLAPATEDSQTMNIYVPGAYMTADGTQTTDEVNGYTAATAPIIYVIDMGGYNSAYAAALSRVTSYLAAGYVVASPNARGRDAVDESGIYIGKGAVCVSDLKAGVRFLKYNADEIPGNTEHIVVTGNSAGGAMAALLASSGNNAAYDELLAQCGAIMTETDDVYAAQMYCPAIDKANADALYEWLFYGQYDGMTEFEAAISQALAQAYVEYINGLGLSGASGEPADLTDMRAGGYVDCALEKLGEALSAYVLAYYTWEASGEPGEGLNVAEAQTFLDGLNADGQWVEYEFVSDADGVVSGIECSVLSIDGFTATCYPRADGVPAYDTLDMTYTMNDLLADENGVPAHFDLLLADILRENDFSSLEGYDPVYDGEYDSAYEHEEEIYLLDPFNFIPDSDVASFIRIRHGTIDNRVPIVTTLNLALALETHSDAAVDYAMVWGKGHGEAELNSADLIAWIESICR